jgi:hypothetical protein
VSRSAQLASAMERGRERIRKCEARAAKAKGGSGQAQLDHARQDFQWLEQQFEKALKEEGLAL